MKTDVLVCRQGEKGRKLVDALAAKGYFTHHLPTFDIVAKAFKFGEKAGNYSDFIYTSINAVECFLNAFSQIETLKNKRHWSIGKSTADALALHGIHARFPKNVQNSEALLRLIYQALLKDDSHFVLVKGKDGRKLLAEQLVKRYPLEVVECYQRVAKAPETLLQKLQALGITSAPKLIIFTSFDGLKTAMPLFDFYPDWKQNSTITVTNSRMSDWATGQGFMKLHRISEYTNPALVNMSDQFLTRKTPDVSSR